MLSKPKSFTIRSSVLLANLPNLITLARLALVPLAIMMIAKGQWEVAFAIFVFAGISDAIDGFLAKRFELNTELGAYLDPVADKALLISIYVALATSHVVPPEIAILVVARDVMIIGAVVIAFLMGRPVEIRPLFISKLNTTAQIVVAALVLAAKAFRWETGLWLYGMLYLVAVLTVASAGAYLVQWFDHMGAGRRPE
jgi:cardiolipin synthase